jgi:Na+/glutamate symporter
MIEFCHAVVFKLLETTYFAMSFVRSAKPSSLGAVGQNVAKISLVTRPRRMAPAAKTSSPLDRC